MDGMEDAVRERRCASSNSGALKRDLKQWVLKNEIPEYIRNVKTNIGMRSDQNYNNQIKRYIW